MRSAFAKDIVRSIRGSMGRFLAIMGIVALGCGFYAGLQMCGPDMRADADALYDGTNLWDVRLISTLGFSDDDVERVRAVEGVEHVMPSLTCDAMARLGTEQVAVRISSIDVDAARDNMADELYAVTSDDDDYLNRPRLVDGRWPKERGECVVSADVPRADYGIGDTVELLYGSGDLAELLDVDELSIVGTVSSSNYPYTGSFGSTNLGSGMIDQYLFVAPASLAKDAPYTEIYLTVRGAREELSESDAYERVVDATKGRLEDLRSELARERRDDVRREAQEQLDEKWDEYDREKAKADRELADAEAELADAAAKIADGERELADGEAQYRDGVATYERERAATQKKLDDAAAQLDRGQKELDASRETWRKGRDELLAQLGAESLGDARTTLEAQRDQLTAARGNVGHVHEVDHDLTARLVRDADHVADGGVVRDGEHRHDVGPRLHEIAALQGAAVHDLGVGQHAHVGIRVLDGPHGMAAVEHDDGRPHLEDVAHVVYLVGYREQVGGVAGIHGYLQSHEIPPSWAGDRMSASSSAARPSGLVMYP